MLHYKQDLRLQLLILYSLFVLSVFALALIFYAREAQRLQRDVREADLSLARAIALETDDLLLKTKLAAISFAQMQAVVEADPNQMEAIFTAGTLARQDVSRIARLSVDGVMRYHYPLNLSSIIGQDFSFTDYFQQARATQNHVFSKAQISPTTDGPVITSANPVFNEGRFDGVVAINVELAGLVKNLEQINKQRSQNDKVNILVVDANRRITAHSRSENLLKDISNSLTFLDDALAGQEGNLVAKDEAGVEWLYSYTPIPSAGWTVIVQHRTELAYASLHNFQRGLAIALVIFGGGAFLFWAFLSYRVIGPLQRLTRYGENVSRQASGMETDHETIAPLSNRDDQIGRLAQSLHHAERSVRRRIAELTTLNKTSTTVVSTLDTQKVIDTILNEVQRLLQVHQCALVMMDENAKCLELRASRGLPPDYAEQLLSVQNIQTLPATLAITTQRPVHVPNVETAENFDTLAPLAKVGGYASLLSIPLITLYGSPAALSIYRTDVHHFNRQEIDLATSFANHAAIALEHALLFSLTDAELQKQVRFLSALHQVSHTVSQSLLMDEILQNAIDIVFDVTPSDACWIFLQREAESFLRLRAQRGFPNRLVAQFDEPSLNQPPGISEQVMAQNQPLLLNRETLQVDQWQTDRIVTEGDWQWLAVVPLRAKESPIGVLGMGTQANQTYSEREIELLQSIGDQIAIAVVNARLYRRSREMATLEERNRVAREIHDTLIQSLTGILIHLQGAKRLSLKNPDKADQSLDDAFQLTQQSLREARRSVLNLRPQVLEELPLDQAIAQQVEAISQANGLQGEFVVEGYPHSLSADIEQHLYRIVQESLTNIKRHAQATKVEVRLNFEAESITLSITDNGIGLKENGVDSDGFGLVGIQERVRLINGHFTISNFNPSGTQISVAIPNE